MSYSKILFVKFFVHGAGLQIHEDGAGHVAAASGLVVVNVDALQLEVRVTVVGA